MGERKISKTVAEAWELEKRTVLQGGCKESAEQHRTRLTASSFGKINRRIQSHLRQCYPIFFSTRFVQSSINFSTRFVQSSINCSR